MWLSTDPLAEKYPGMSPYNYCFNNPLYYTDPDGKEPTPLEAALMASHIYDGKIKLEGGWKLSAMGYWNKYDEKSGIKGAMYERFTSDGVSEYAYIYAGTEDLKVDGLEDLKQVAGMSKQYEEAEKIAIESSEYIGKNQELSFGGHSLGGGLANYSSMVTGRSSITVNPAWVSQATFSSASKRNRLKILMSGCYNLNLIHQSDPLNKIQSAQGHLVGLLHLGKDQKINGGLFSNIFTGHLINTAIERMFKNGGNQTEVHKGDRNDKIIHASPRDF